MKPISLLLVLAVSPAFAADKPLRLPGGPKSEDALRRFVTSDKRLKARIADAALREEDFRVEGREPGLRDALSDANSSDEIIRQLGKASGADKERLLDRLPGLPTDPAPRCATLKDCAVPELAAGVASADRIPETLRRLVRPWMLLQQARHSAVVLTPIDKPGDAVLLMELKESDADPITLNVTPRPLGGFNVWFDRPLVLADLYGRERDAALNPVRR